MRLSELLADLRHYSVVDLGRWTQAGLAAVTIGRTDAIFTHAADFYTITIVAGTDPVLEPEVIADVNHFVARSRTMSH